MNDTGNPNDNGKSRAQLIAELEELRQQLASLRQSENWWQRIAEELRISETGFRTIIDQSPLCIVIYSPVGKMLHMNRAAKRLWDVPDHFQVDYNIFGDEQLRSKGLHPYIARAFAGEAVTLPIVMYDSSLTPPNFQGRTRWVESFFYPIKDEAGKIHQIILIQNDVTEHKEATVALQQAHDELEARVAERTTELWQANAQLTQQLLELKRADEQREILQQILENIPLMIDYYDEHGQILLINPTWEKTFGWTLNDLKTSGQAAFLEAILPDPEYRQRVLKHMTNSPSGWRDLKVTVASGEELYTCWNTIRLSNGKTIGIGQDITERKRAEAALQKSEAMLRDIVEGVVDAIYLKDQQGRYIMINSAGAKFLGKTSEEVIGKTDDQCFALETAHRIMAADRNVMERGEVSTFEDIATAAGITRTFFTIKAPHRDNSGKVIGLIGISRDITERKRAEEALAEEKERLAVTLRSIGDGVITTDTNGRVVLINKAAERLTGWTENEATGQPLSRVCHLISEKTRKPCRNPVDRVLKTGRRVERSNHTVLIRRDEGELIVSDSAAPIQDEEGRIIGVVLVIRDVTEKRKIEEKLVREQAARAAAKLAETRLSESNLQLRALSSHVLRAQEDERLRLARELHDELGQALTSIKLALELAVSALPAGPAGNLERTRRTLNDLCTYVETTAKDVQRVARDLRPSVLDDFGLAAALESYCDAYTKRTGIKISLSLDPLSQPLSKEVETALYRIIQEALTNAAKHSGAKNISIDLSQQSGEIVLTIFDDGRGFCSEKLLRASQQQGFGLLGMAERARMVGAQLSMNSQPNRGLCIQVTLSKR